MSVVVSVRVPKWVKKKLEEHGINVAELVKQKLIEEAIRLEEEDIDKELEEVGKELAKRLDINELAELIDEDRKAR